MEHPIVAMQSSVSPWQGLFAGSGCVPCIISMQSAGMATLLVVSTIRGPAANAASWANKPSKAPSKRIKGKVRFTARHIRR